MKKSAAVVFLFLGIVSAAFAARRGTQLLHSTKAKKEKSLQLQWVRVPEDKEICFSPDEKCGEKIYKFIESAKTSLDIAIYDINIKELGALLRDKAQTIPIRIVVDYRQASEPNSIVKALMQAEAQLQGIQIRVGRLKNTAIMHNKFTIRDAATENAMIETGSFNYTNHARESNYENQIYLADPKIVERYKKEFEMIWKEATPAALKPKLNLAFESLPQKSR